jgi:hypothetical protein
MLPAVLAQVRALVGQRRLTVVFDRGGYSPKLFQQIIGADFDLLTYRKGRYRHIPRKRFQTCRTRRQGQTITYVLADQNVRLLKGRLRLRQVTRLMDNGHQTPILTSRRDLSAAQVAYRMFDRWRQENFFKYLREEYALDALVEYAAVPDDPTREVPNPAWAAVDAQLRQAHAQLDRLQAEYGLEALTNLEQMRRTMRGFKTAQGKLGQKIWTAWERVQQLEKRRAAVPRRVPVQAVTAEPVVKLAPERKHLTNLIKMVAYQAESDLAPVSGPPLPESGRRRSNPPPSGLGQRGGSGSQSNGVARDAGSAKFATPHTCHRGPLRGTQPNEYHFSRARDCACLRGSGGS